MRTQSTSRHSFSSRLLTADIQGRTFPGDRGMPHSILQQLQETLHSCEALITSGAFALQFCNFKYHAPAGYFNWLISLALCQHNNG
jgi:hypothetical protein